MFFLDSLSRTTKQPESHFDFAFEADRLCHGQEFADERREKAMMLKASNEHKRNRAASWLADQLEKLTSEHSKALSTAYGVAGCDEARNVRQKLRLAKHSILEISDTRWGRSVTDGALHRLNRDAFHFRREARL